MKNQKALVVFSGGQDSTTCLFWAKKKFKEVEAVTFKYGQRHEEEIHVARRICEDLSIQHHEIDMSVLSQLTSNALTRHDQDIETSENGVPTTFVDGRNLLFLSFAAIIGRSIDAKHIVTGVCETDFSGYPDCRDQFIKSLNVTLNLSMDDQFVIHTPLMWLTKEETWELADELEAFDYVRNNTLTCYNGVMADGCGECPACELRKNGLDAYLARKEAM